MNRYYAAAILLSLGILAVAFLTAKDEPTTAGSLGEPPVDLSHG